MNCSQVINFEAQANHSNGDHLYFAQRIPNTEMVTPWSNWKVNETQNTISYYGEFFRLNSFLVPSNFPFEAFILDYQSTNLHPVGSIASGFIQTDRYNPGFTAPTVVFDESNGAALRFQQKSFNYSAGVLYNATVNLSVYAGEFSAPSSYTSQQAIQELMSSSLPTVCEIPVRFRLTNSCSITSEPIKFGSVTTADIKNDKASYSSSVSINCLLNDSVSLSLSGDSQDNEGYTLISMGSNLQTKLALMDDAGNIISSTTPIKTQGGVSVNRKVKASLEVIDKTKPMAMSDVSGNAVVTLSYN